MGDRKMKKENRRRGGYEVVGDIDLADSRRRMRRDGIDTGRLKKQITPEEQY